VAKKLNKFLEALIPLLNQKTLAEREFFYKTVLDNKWIPKTHIPTPKQARFLFLRNLEAFYGGAAAGGKTDALLMAALQFVEVPYYRALLLRRSYSDLNLPKALMDRSIEWLYETDALWNGKDYAWTFPRGAELSFGYLKNENDKYRYGSSEYHFIGFDELTEFTETQYAFLFSRLRKTVDDPIPIRMRSASNPVGPGFPWVKQRFIIEGKEKNRVFIPARLEDNPHVDLASYEDSLSRLDPITRARLRSGDWNLADVGKTFQQEWFDPLIKVAPSDARRVRYWDMASTQPKPGTDPDYTVGVLMSRKDGVYYVEHIVRFRGPPAKNEATIKQTAALDGKNTTVVMEQEPGSSGVTVIDHYRRHVLDGYAFYGNKTTGSKELRAAPFSSACEARNVHLVEGMWIRDYLDELAVFPSGTHDDQVDAASGAYEWLSRRGGELQVEVGKVHYR
jgi:predicted phage terminase large subunit-like protein